MNIGRRYWKSTIKTLPAEQTKVLEIFEAYLGNIHENRAEGWGFIIWGANGVGKTYAATAILKEYVRWGYTAYAVLTDVLKSAYIEGPLFDPDMKVTTRVETVDVLLLEDIGKEYSGKGSGWAELCVENLLRKRSRELRPTIITTNLSPQAFKDRYAESAAAIVRESMVSVNMKGSDWRQVLARQKLEEFKS